MDTGFEERFVHQLAAMYAEVGPLLDERQRRLVLGSAARQIGRGGIKRVAAAVGVAPETVGRGCRCRKHRPCSSGGVSVFVEDAAESIASSDVEAVRFGDRLGERA